MSSLLLHAGPIHLTWSDGKVNAAASQPSMILSAGGRPRHLADRLGDTREEIVLQRVRLGRGAGLVGHDEQRSRHLDHGFGPLICAGWHP
jgi:hypothetical protein